MIDYSFREGLPEDFVSGFDDDIFCHPQQLRLQAKEGWFSFGITNNNSGELDGVIHFHLDASLAMSPYRSPYGSIFFLDEIPDNVLAEFITFFLRKLRERGIKKIVIKNSPENYLQQKAKKINKIFQDSDFLIVLEETSAIISVTKNPFESVVHSSEKKRLRRCKEVGLELQYVSLSKLEEVYNFLRVIREKKKYSLSMSLEELRRLSSLFPDRVFLTTVRKDHILVAANISIRVNSLVLYNFYHDHDDAYDHLSPVVFLNKGLYEFCQRSGLAMLDLGTSQKDGGLNESLLNFKIRLGAVPSRKLTFEKILT